jgi:PKD repeat protein
MRKYLFFLLTLLIYSQLPAQNTPVNQTQQAEQILQDRGEIVISFTVSDKDQINNDLTNIMSIDKVTEIPNGQGFEVRAYANEQEFQAFLTRNIPYTIIPKLSPKALTMATTVAQMANWDRYPTYSVYEQMMTSFASNYPTLCDIDTILSPTPSGNYKILVAKISDNVNTAENEPQFLFTSSIHGDETTGFILTLRMISYLLTNYGTLTKVTNLVNNAEIWICPLANPDGTYYNSSPAGSSISNSRRYNQAGIDMNRNYPDPRAGQHPDGGSWAAETQAFMTFATNHHFNMSVNFHGGTEVTNYPWDTWTTAGNPNADRLWWERVCTEYVDTTRLINAAYMTDTYADGVTEGGDWYVITGGRQDYMNFYKHCREATIELDVTKTTAVADLNNKWNENYRSMLNYIQESLYGVRGIITDSCTGLPIRAKVWVTSYDQTNDSSQVYSALPVGNYHKYMIAGTYSITFSATGYTSKTINNIVLANGAATVVNVQLVPSTLVNPDAQFTGTVTDACLGTATFTNSSTSSSSFMWYFGDGATSTLTNPTHTYASSGTYTVKLKAYNCKGSDSLVRTNYIIINLSTVTPSVSISASATTICAGTTVNFTPTPTNGGTPTYQWKINGSNAGTGSTFSTSALVQGDVVTCVMTSTAACASPTTATSNSIIMTVNSVVTPSVVIGASATTICAGTTVNFTSTPTNGGTPGYQWKVNSTIVGTGSTYSNSTLVQGDVVTCIMTSTATCASPTTATSNAITMTVNSIITPSVVIGASATTICVGTTVNFTATPTNGGTPTYQWIVNSTNVGNGSTYNSSTLAQGDIVTCVMTSTAACVSPTTATSNPITMTVNSSVTPSVVIGASSTNICTGTTVNFTATPTNGGTPTYQWKVNSSNVGTGSNYSSSSLVQGDIVTCVMTSTANCASPATVTSNPITMTVNSVVTPSIVIGASATTICAGTTVNFTATPTNGGTPSYQWIVNSANVGTGSTYSSSTLAQGDVVTCVMTSSVSCASPTTATSNPIVMTVNPVLTPSVIIGASATTICAGTTINFTATPTNGGTPSYQWKLNSIDVGTGSTYSNSTLVQGDVVTCIMTSTATCASPTTATSNPIIITVNQPVTPSVIIGASGTTICPGTSVTFNATADNGGIPSFQWLINGNPAGNNNVLFTSSTLSNGDVVSCIMTSTADCASPATATSNSIIMVVNPVLVPSVDISADPGSIICPGSTILFTAIPTNGGTPLYQWTIDGINTGTLSTLAGTFSDGQIIGCTMTSTADCASPLTVNATPITVNYFVVLPVTVTENLGSLESSAIYGNQWYEQSTGLISGATSQTYVPIVNGNYFTVVTDINGCTDTSNVYNMTTVGIANEKLPGINIYPNPSSGKFTLELNESSIVEIYDALGSLIYNASFEKGKHNLSYSLADGVYLLRATNERGSRSMSLFIQK